MEKKTQRICLCPNIVLFLTDEFCEEFPHNFIPTPGYWIECSRQKIATDTIWDESESDHELPEGDEEDRTDGTDQENGHHSRIRDLGEWFVIEIDRL